MCDHDPESRWINFGEWGRARRHLSPEASSVEKNIYIFIYWNRPLSNSKKQHFIMSDLLIKKKKISQNELYKMPFIFLLNDSRPAWSDVLQQCRPPLLSTAEHVCAAFSMSAHANLSCAYYSTASSRWINTCWKYYWQDICMWPKSLTSAPPCKQVSAKTL